METLGKHYIAELWNVDANKLNDIKKIEENMVKAAESANGHVLNVYGHKFSPQGVSVVITISESHLSIHTFPEEGYCAIDTYTCGKTFAENAIKHLIDYFQPKEKNIIKLVRGIKEDVEINKELL